MTPIISRLGFAKGFGRRQGGPPSYAFAQSTTTVNEGSPVVFDVTTRNVTSGTLLYFTTVQVSGTINASDFSDNATSGSFAITNNSGTLTRTLASDFTTEGTESFQIEIRTESVSGDILFTSDTITISDTSVTPPLTVRYLVIAGGGGGGSSAGGGGGAGGYRTASSIPLSTGVNYTVTVGGGGAGGFDGPVSATAAQNGSPSTFNTITSSGGGHGGGQPFAGSGGSGGGGSGTPYPSGSGASGNVPPVSPPQGNPGGDGPYPTPDNRYAGGGGGGAGAAGNPSLSGSGGGQGNLSDIIGYNVWRAGGGGGAGRGPWPGSGPQPVYGGSGGTGGGGSGSTSATGNNGTAATGGGGGGTSGPWPDVAFYSRTGGNGGSGVVILRYPQYHTISNPGGGLVMNTSPAPGSDKYTQISAGTGNVSWS